MVNKYKIIKPLVIGIGVAGRRHLEAQLNLGIKTGVYTTNPQTAKSLIKLKNVIIFEKLEDGLDWSNLVHVCTPDDKHTEYVAKAIKKAKVVLCEKSFTTSLKDALYLQDLAHKYHATVIIGQNYRLTPSFAETKRRIQDGQLGNINHIETTYLHDKTDFQQRYTDKNFLYIGGSHAIDLACWIVGEQIVNVKVTSRNKLYYQISVKFSSGILGNIKLDASSDRSINGTDLIVYGERGKLASQNKLDKILFYKKGSKEPQLIHCLNIQTHTISLEIKKINDYLLGKIDSFRPLPGVDEAVKVIEILDSIHSQFWSETE